MRDDPEDARRYQAEFERYQEAIKSHEAARKIRDVVLIAMIGLCAAAPIIILWGTIWRT